MKKINFNNKQIFVLSLLIIFLVLNSIFAYLINKQEKVKTIKYSGKFSDEIEFRYPENWLIEEREGKNPEWPSFGIVLAPNEEELNKLNDRTKITIYKTPILNEEILMNRVRQGLESQDKRRLDLVIDRKLEKEFEIDGVKAYQFSDKAWFSNERYTMIDLSLGDYGYSMQYEIGELKSEQEAQLIKDVFWLIVDSIKFNN